MALKLRKKKPRKPQPVDIGGGVTLWVRPAEYSESIAAAESITPLIIALREGSAAAAQVAEMLGEEFADAQWSDAQLAAAADKLALMHLVAAGCVRIEGKLLLAGDDDDDDEALTEVTVVDVAIAGLLVRDGVIARRLRTVIDAPLHEVLAEKKESAALPNGEAAAPATAPVAGKPEPTAH